MYTHTYMHLWLHTRCQFLPVARDLSNVAGGHQWSCHGRPVRSTCSNPNSWDLMVIYGDLMVIYWDFME